MPAIALGEGQSQVFSKTGTGNNCNFSVITTTDESSSKVTIGGFGVVREGDRVASHSASGCGVDTSVITSYSSKVSVEGRGVARIGDEYTSDNIIISGSSKVFIGV